MIFFLWTFSAFWTVSEENVRKFWHLLANARINWVLSGNVQMSSLFPSVIDRGHFSQYKCKCQNTGWWHKHYDIFYWFLYCLKAYHICDRSLYFWWVLIVNNDYIKKKPFSLLWKVQVYFSLLSITFITTSSTAFSRVTIRCSGLYQCLAGIPCRIYLCVVFENCPQCVYIYISLYVYTERRAERRAPVQKWYQIAIDILKYNFYNNNKKISFGIFLFLPIPSNALRKQIFYFILAASFYIFIYCIYILLQSDDPQKFKWCKLLKHAWYV